MKPKLKGVKFRAANGEDMHYHGRKDIEFKPVGGGTPCSMEFHVTNATKPLASAMAVVKAGNRVILDKGGCYIENKKTMFDIEPAQGFTLGADFARRG